MFRIYEHKWARKILIERIVYSRPTGTERFAPVQSRGGAIVEGVELEV